MSAGIFVHIAEPVVTLATTGAFIAAIGAGASGIAFGARQADAGAFMLAAWVCGLFLSMLAIVVLVWWPLTVTLVSLGGAVVLGSLTAGVRALLRRRR